MFEKQHRRGWFLVAAIAIGIALVFLLIPHPGSADSGALAILPLLFVGIISPLTLLSPLAFQYVTPATESPALPVSFQRPPPCQFA
jgi:hypothetical protein